MNESDRNKRGSCGDRRPRNDKGDGRGSRDGGRDFRIGKGRRLPTTPPFLGDTIGMNGHIFQYRSENTDPKQFAVTLEKISLRK